jgi:hypothetical protein
MSFPQAIEKMKSGASLRFEHDQTRPAWSIDGEPVHPEVVNLLITTKGVEPDNDGLFDGAVAQTWKLRSVK